LFTYCNKNHGKSQKVYKYKCEKLELVGLELIRISYFTCFDISNIKTSLYHKNAFNNTFMI